MGHCWEGEFATDLKSQASSCHVKSNCWNCSALVVVPAGFVLAVAAAVVASLSVVPAVAVPLIAVLAAVASLIAVLALVAARPSILVFRTFFIFFFVNQ